MDLWGGGIFLQRPFKGTSGLVDCSHNDEKLGSPIGHIRAAVILSTVEELVSLKCVATNKCMDTSYLQLACRCQLLL